MFSHQINDDIVLRLYAPCHAKELFALADRNRDHLRPWLPWIESTRTVQDQLGFIKAMRTKYGNGTDLAIGIWFQGELVGSIGLHRIDEHNKSAEIGYWLSADAQGKGIMTRACRAVINHGFHDLGLNRITIRVAPDNKASRAIPERLAFVQEGILRQASAHYDGFIDLVFYGMLAAEWDAQS
ncbi:MAG: GNAT family N-acetyltransferase [Candidatus Promineifilaceae bacterium]